MSDYLSEIAGFSVILGNNYKATRNLSRSDLLFDSAFH